MKTHDSHIKGILLMSQAAFAFSIMALCVKFASKTLPSLEIVFFRSFIGMVMILAVMMKRKISILGRERWLMVLRGITGFIALTLHFYTIAHLKLGTAVMLNYTGPMFTAIFASFFLGEKPGWILISMILVSFTGVFLLVGGEIHGFSLMIFLGILSAVFVGIVYVLIRAISHRESAYTVIFYFTLVSTIGSIFFLPFGFKWPGFGEWLLLAGVGVGSFYGQLWFTTSLRCAPASLVSPFSYLTPLFSFVYGVLWFGESLSTLSIFGACLIILGGATISIVEARKEKPAAVK